MTTHDTVLEQFIERMPRTLCEYAPPDNGRIWRYYRLPRFIQLLEERMLFFARADKFEDPWEGALPKPTAEMIRRAQVRCPREERRGRSDAELAITMAKNLRRYTVISCWHMSEGDSAAMWKLYASEEDGVRVASTPNDLFTSLPRDPNSNTRVYIGQVRYDLDYAAEPLSLLDIHAYLHKRKNFDHEREVRAIAQRIPHEPVELLRGAGISGGGMKFPVDLDMFCLRTHETFGARI